MFRRLVLALAVLAGFSGIASAYTLDPLKGWATAIHLDKAVKAAKKKNVPIVLLYAPQEGGGAVVRARVYMRLPALRGMVRVLVYESSRPPSVFQKVADQVEGPSESLPIMYIATPELKILGFVQSGAHKKTANRVIGHVKRTMTWIKKSRKEIASAEKRAQAGKFGTLLTTLKRINNEDKKAGVLTTSTWNIVLSKDEVDTFYFPEVPGKIEGVPEGARAHLEKVRAAMTAKDYKEARRLVFPMAIDSGDLEALKEAKDLLKQIDAAMKE